MHLELEVNLLVHNVIEREIEREKVQMKPSISMYRLDRRKCPQNFFVLVHCTKLRANRACAPIFGSAPSYKLSERAQGWENVRDTFYGPDGAYVYIEGY